jgi:DNA-binding MarR family transcriptional regulator
METKILQRLRREEADSFQLAEKYYSLLSAINNLKLTQREVQLIAFTAIKGNISYANIREEFCKKYGTTSPTINNIISKLKKIGVLVKDGTKVKVNPVIILNFDKDITLEIKLTHGQA